VSIFPHNLHIKIKSLNCPPDVHPDPPQVRLTSIKDAKFSIAEKIREPGAYFAKLIWSVEAAKNGTPGSVFIFVEPFGGEIVGISQ
jgi:hypothetical protein